MAISVQFGICTEDPRKIDKRSNFLGSSPVTIPCTIKDNCSIQNPILVVSPASINLSKFNYAHISIWGRYYFIVDMFTMPGGRVSIKCTEDYLTSNADQILALSLYLDRTADTEKSNKYLPDSRIPTELRRQQRTIDFNMTPFTANYGSDVVYVLTVLGGAHSGNG